MKRAREIPRGRLSETVLTPPDPPSARIMSIIVCSMSTAARGAPRRCRFADPRVWMRYVLAAEVGRAARIWKCHDDDAMSGLTALCQ